MTQITRGFEDPVHDALQAFRKVLDAMSKPGTIAELASDVSFGSASAAASQILLTLADNNTPLWLSGCFTGDEALAENIRFHIAAPVTGSVMEATFALVKAEEAFELGDFRQGDEEYPETSTTILVEVEGFGVGKELSLTGPGIQSVNTLKVKGLPSNLLRCLIAREEAGHLAVDILLTAGNCVVALPRTTKIAAVNRRPTYVCSSKRR